MRLATWNCNTSARITSATTAARVFTAKSKYMSDLQVDVAVLQEIAQPEIPDTSTTGWFGQLLGRGVGVVTGSAYTLQSYPRDPSVRSVLPFRIFGPISFNLLAVWSCPERTSLRNYVRDVYNGLDRYAALLANGPTVVMGDFNSNATSDRQVGAINHSTLARHLEDHGLASCYHRFFNVVQGQELHPTFYLYRHLDKSFHVDYCFIPAAWHIEDVHVGSYVDWRERSDHCPLVVDVRAVA